MKKWGGRKGGNDRKGRRIMALKTLDVPLAACLSSHIGLILLPFNNTTSPP